MKRLVILSLALFVGFMMSVYAQNAHPSFPGGEEALRALIDAAHSRGMSIILDGVFNHTGAVVRTFFSLRDHGWRGHRAYRYRGRLVFFLYRECRGDSS